MEKNTEILQKLNTVGANKQETTHQQRILDTELNLQMTQAA